MPAMYLLRPDPSEYAPYFERYISQVPDGDVLALLASQVAETSALLEGLSEEQALYAYAPGKWSIKEVVGHVADAERFFAHRALCAARLDATPLPSFSENDYVRVAEFNRQPLPALVDEFQTVRSATLALLHGLPPEAMTRLAATSPAPVSVRAAAYIIAGHEHHHRRLLVERYGLGG